MENILNFTLEELEKKIIGMGEKKFRAKQILDWLYKKNSFSFDGMTNLSEKFRSALKEKFFISGLTLSRLLSSSDGTRKMLFELRDGLAIESVIIPSDDGRLTLCVSSQAGCPLGCRFCMTGKSGFKKNLESGEIVGQFLEAGRQLGKGGRITNIVFMGMGEPFLNFRQVVRALEIITSENGLGFSPRRITVSTSGIIDKMAEFGKLNLGALSVSINSADDDKRTNLMPVNKKYPLEKLIKACKLYPTSRQEKLTLEYVLIRDMNDSNDDARRMAFLVRGIKCKVNLIPFNECEGLEFRGPDPLGVVRFQKVLEKHGCEVFLRESRGQDISAACGQLGAEATGFQA